MATIALGADRSRLRSFNDILHSEFWKLSTVRSTYWTLLAAVVFNVVVAAALAIILPGALSAEDAAAVDATRVSLGGIHLSQVAFGVLGVLVITSEYGTGMIRATFAAVPRRKLVLAAKMVAFAAVALFVGTASCFAAFFVFQGFLPDGTMRTSLGDPEVLRAVLGGGLYLTAFGLLGVGIGAIVRVSAGAIAAVLGLLFVPSLLVGLLPPDLQTDIRPYVPMEAGSQIFIVTPHDPSALEPWTGFGVFAIYVVAALVAGFILIDRRDA